MTTERKSICVSKQDLDLLATMCYKIEFGTQKRFFICGKKYCCYFLIDANNAELAQKLFAKYHIDLEQHKSRSTLWQEPRLVLRAEQKNMPVYAKSLFAKIDREHLQLVKPENESRLAFMQSVIANAR